MLSDLSSKGTSALVVLDKRSGVDFSKVVAVETQCWPDSARPCLEPRRHRLRRAAASSGEGLVPRECGDDLRSSAVIQLGGQQGSGN